MTDLREQYFFSTGHEMHKFLADNGIGADEYEVRFLPKGYLVQLKVPLFDVRGSD